MSRGGLFFQSGIQTGFMHLAPTSEHNVLKVFIVVRQLARLVSEFLFAKETLQRQLRLEFTHF